MADDIDIPGLKMLFEDVTPDDEGITVQDHKITGPEANREIKIKPRFMQGLCWGKTTTWLENIEENNLPLKESIPDKELAKSRQGWYTDNTKITQSITAQKEFLINAGVNPNKWEKAIKPNEKGEVLKSSKLVRDMHKKEGAYYLNIVGNPRNQATEDANTVSQSAALLVGKNSTYYYDPNRGLSKIDGTQQYRTAIVSGRIDSAYKISDNADREFPFYRDAPGVLAIGVNRPGDEDGELSVFKHSAPEANSNDAGAGEGSSSGRLRRSSRTPSTIIYEETPDIIDPIDNRGKNINQGKTAQFLQNVLADDARIENSKPDASLSLEKQKLYDFSYAKVKPYRDQMNIDIKFMNDLSFKAGDNNHKFKHTDVGFEFNEVLEKIEQKPGSYFLTIDRLGLAKDRHYTHSVGVKFDDNKWAIYDSQLGLAVTEGPPNESKAAVTEFFNRYYPIDRSEKTKWEEKLDNAVSMIEFKSSRVLEKELKPDREQPASARDGGSGSDGQQSWAEEMKEGTPAQSNRRVRDEISSLLEQDSTKRMRTSGPNVELTPATDQPFNNRNAELDDRTRDGARDHNT